MIIGKPVASIGVVVLRSGEWRRLLLFDIPNIDLAGAFFLSTRKIILFSVMAALAVSSSLWTGHKGTPSGDLAAFEGRTLPCRTTDPPGIGVEWVETADASDREALAIGCTSVGPVVVREFAGGDSLPMLDSLVVVTWNTHVGGGDVISFVGRVRDGEFTGGRRPEHFVLLLQEVFRAGPEVPVGASAELVPARIAETPPSGERIDIVETARRLELNLFYVPSMKNGVAKPGEVEEDRGNAILSTFRLRDLTAIELPLERYRRVAIAVTARGVTSSGSPWTLRVCNVHLDTRSDFPRVLESVGMGRLRQARAIVPVVPEKDVVLGGDFNTWGPSPTEGAIDYLLEQFPQSGELDHEPTVSIAVLPDRRTDYLFFRLSGERSARYHRLDDRMGSDHYPLLGVIQLTSREHGRSSN
jgi:endonuclease/exonuclease/phosphatase family metal-dependent hydrolase